MKILKHTLLITALAVANTSAQASLWDSVTSLFGGESTETQAAPAASATETTATKTSEMISTGLKLIPLLTQTLGVTDGQAEGGMGALLQAAQALMGGSDYSTLAQAIPSASALLSAAPALQTESGGLMDTAMKMASEQSDTVKVGADLVSQFKTLGMGADMIPKFTDAAESYLTQSGSSDASGLLSSALSFL
jgi:hypothetical protein